MWRSHSEVDGCVLFQALLQDVDTSCACASLPTDDIPETSTLLDELLGSVNVLNESNRKRGERLCSENDEEQC